MVEGKNFPPMTATPQGADLRPGGGSGRIGLEVDRENASAAAVRCKDCLLRRPGGLTVRTPEGTARGLCSAVDPISGDARFILELSGGHKPFSPEPTVGDARFREESACGIQPGDISYKPSGIPVKVI